jgi:homocysteine S-methyltransferase
MQRWLPTLVVEYGRIGRVMPGRSSRLQDPVAALLERRPIAILDGALATELERRGADLHDPLWSAKVLIEQPELIRAVHADYFAAGADIATTATYQATFEGFGRRGIDGRRAARLMREAVALAIGARDEFWAVAANRCGRERPLVAASVGPFGAMRADGSEYRGEYGLSDVALRDFHRPRLAVLAESGADLLACETIPTLQEAEALVAVLEEFPGTAAWISFACRDAAHTCEGQRIGDCARRLAGCAQVVALGVNCTAPAHVAGLLRELRAETTKPLAAYPNSGEHYDAHAKRWSGSGAEIVPGFAAAATAWAAAGAQLIGGCCRTTPADIRALKNWTDGARPAIDAERQTHR